VTNGRWVATNTQQRCIVRLEFVELDIDTELGTPFCLVSKGAILGVLGCLGITSGNILMAQMGAPISAAMDARCFPSARNDGH